MCLDVNTNEKQTPLYFTTYTEINSKQTEGLIMKSTIIKFLEEENAKKYLPELREKKGLLKSDTNKATRKKKY